MCVVPEPIEGCAIYALRGLRYIIKSPHVGRCWQRSYTLIFFHFPTAIRVSDTFCFRITAEYKCCSIADLSQWRECTKVPYCRSKLISSGMQEWRQVVCFVFPMGQITQCGTAANLTLVSAQKELVVGANVDNKVFGNLGNLKNLPEMQNNAIPLWCVG